jgi:hypothetical protein
MVFSMNTPLSLTSHSYSFVKLIALKCAVVCRNVDWDRIMIFPYRIAFTMHQSAPTSR